MTLNLKHKEHGVRPQVKEMKVFLMSIVIILTCSCFSGTTTEKREYLAIESIARRTFFIEKIISEIYPAQKEFPATTMFMISSYYDYSPKPSPPVSYTSINRWAVSTGGSHEIIPYLSDFFQGINIGWLEKGKMKLTEIKLKGKNGTEEEEIICSDYYSEYITSLPFFINYKKLTFAFCKFPFKKLNGHLLSNNQHRLGFNFYFNKKAFKQIKVKKNIIENLEEKYSNNLKLLKKNSFLYSKISKKERKFHSKKKKLYPQNQIFKYCHNNLRVPSS